MDTTVRLGPLKFSLQATIDNHGPSIHSGHYTASINFCKKNPFYCNGHTITELELLIKTHLLQILFIYKLIDTWFLDSNRRVGVWSLMALAHPLHPIDNRSRNQRRNLRVGLCVSSWWPWFPSRSSVLIYIYICMCITYTSSVTGRIYNGSVIQYWRSCTPSRCISGECAVPVLNATFCFFWFTNCVLFFDKSLILGCLWPLAFVLNNTLILGIWCSTIPTIPRMFLSLDFLWEYRIQHGANGLLYVTSSYSTWIFCRGFRLCNWLSLWRLLSWINELPPACASTFWKSNFKQQLGCRFDIMDNKSYFVFWHMQLYLSWYIRLFFGFTFLNILYFFKYSSTNIFHRRSLYTFY